MGQKVYELDALTRTCHRCGELKTRDFFSMTPGLFDEWSASQDRNTNPICNPCQIESNRTGKFSAPPDRERWRKDAACGPAVIPLKRQGDVTRLMDPLTALERQTKAWRKYCDRCPVKQQCAEFGEISDSSGVWGGEYRPEKPMRNRRDVVAEANGNPMTDINGPGRPRKHNIWTYRNTGCRCEPCVAAFEAEGWKSARA